MVALLLLILTFFSQDYSLIREATFIDFSYFSLWLHLKETWKRKFTWNVKNHYDFIIIILELHNCPLLEDK